MPTCVPDFSPVDLSVGPVLFATYSPATASPNQPSYDVTQQVRNLQLLGQLHFNGIHTKIGDPFPGVPKTLKLWFVNEPDLRITDNQDFPLLPFKQVICVSYAPIASGESNIEPFNDVTQVFLSTIKDTPSDSEGIWRGGPARYLPDPFPGQAKVMKIWYA